jgi:hypothetical protein
MGVQKAPAAGRRQALPLFPGQKPPGRGGKGPSHGGTVFEVNEIKGLAERIHSFLRNAVG